MDRQSLGVKKWKRGEEFKTSPLSQEESVQTVGFWVLKNATWIAEIEPIWFFFDFHRGKPGTQTLFEHLGKVDVIFNDQCFTHGFESAIQVIFPVR